MKLIAILALAALADLATSAHAQTTVLYSRLDTPQALRALALARVYDRAGIDLAVQPGAQWRPTIAAAICRSRAVLVLWSAHAAASAELAQELATARQCRARLVPLLLDNTPLPAGLAELQAVDWR